jgi:hypothetical protein
MKRTVSLMLVLMFAMAAFATAAFAEEKMVGVITKMSVAADGKSGSATLKDNKSGKEVTVTVTDDLTLDKFKDHRIVVGDEIRLKYESKDGKNVSKYFRKTAGC